MIGKDTAMDIALAYREIETAEKLLADITKELDRHQAPDIRDVFGRRADGLSLGVPTSENARTIFNVPWRLAKPVIEAHIAQHRARLGALNEKARAELDEVAA